MPSEIDCDNFIRNDVMSYVYEHERHKLFTEEGQIMFLAIRDQAHKRIAEAGAVRSDKLLGVTSGDAWVMLACMDRMIELGELIEITDDNAPGQRRVFVKGRN
jgi:hypothetical protein